MKKFNFSLISLLMLILASCSESVTETVTYRINEPVFMSRDAFRSSVKVSATPHEITGYGKISYYQGYLYMSEPGKGIHIIDNSNPSSPSVTGYIELLGNADVSIRNNMLYADSYVDLVWFDVTNPSSPVFKGRLQNVFPEAVPMIRNGVGFDWDMCYGEKKQEGVIVGWKEVERTEDIDDYRGGWFWRWGWMEGDVLAATSKDFASNSSTNSISGSMSRFTLYSDYLYTVVNNQMTIFDLTKASPEVAADSIYIGWNVETIFSYKNNMFFGTPTGMLIYSVENPLKPEWKSSIQHVFGCDPVVVEDDIAYVTVHSGVNCRTGTTVNDLIIIDVKDVTKPKQIVSYSMTKPKGLGIDNKKLFVCDDGLRIFKADNPMTIMANELAHYKGMAGYDVIPFNNVLMMIAEDGIYQYDYSNVNNIRKLSYLPVKKAE